MMIKPEGPIYAWVYLDTAVIAFFDVNPGSPEPSTSQSSPIIGFSHIDYAFFPADQALVESFPKISGGGRHTTTVRTIVIDIPLHMPSVEDLFAFAKERKLHLDRLLEYALYRFQKSIAEYQLAIAVKGDLQKASKETNYWRDIVAQITGSIPRP
jgi:hypothetical protein